MHFLAFYPVAVSLAPETSNEPWLLGIFAVVAKSVFVGVRVSGIAKQHC